MQSDAPAALIYVSEDLLGDALLKLPALAVLRQAFPGYHLTWMTGGGPSVFAGELAPLSRGLVDEVRDQERLGRSWREFWGKPPLYGHRPLLCPHTWS